MTSKEMAKILKQSSVNTSLQKLKKNKKFVYLINGKPQKDLYFKYVVTALNYQRLVKTRFPTEEIKLINKENGKEYKLRQKKFNTQSSQEWQYF